MGCAIDMFSKRAAPNPQATPMEKRFLILGLDNAGKTSVLYRLSKKENGEICPTIGLNVEQLIHKNVSVSLWDIGGAATLLWKHYYQGTDAIIFVIDSTDRVRLETAKEELMNLLLEPDVSEAPLLVYANKQDMKEAMNVNDLSISLEFDKIGRKHKFLQACSAVNNEGIMEGFEQIVDILIKATPKGQLQLER
eukprot:TRINITY_DN2381_c0_g1_i2.p2 TRINITY_DN2381_c0_g1~~TRINITY_DN2381_c0_g1_i2.p2  ORF type:complete len:194 (+),score=25.16 TRINITY_DN2381_c0_g1_i2:110-691(+)